MTLKQWAGRMLPARWHEVVWAGQQALGTAVTQFRLAWIRGRWHPRDAGDRVRIGRWRLRITDGPNLYVQYKDEFLRRIYHFRSARPDPRIIDGGCNIGMSILYFKQVYPQARIIGFEPDPAIFQLLRGNLADNGIDDVRLVPSALGGADGKATFHADHTSGGQLVSQDGEYTVAVARLSPYLAEEVDFLKLNIEGQEAAVLKESAEAGRLRNVRELVLEYHGWPAGRQSLGEILSLLDAHGFRYLVHDFDAETCPATKPPFRLRRDTPWFCLVYAIREDAMARE